MGADPTLQGTKVVVITAMEGEVEEIASPGVVLTREPALSLGELMGVPSDQLRRSFVLGRSRQRSIADKNSWRLIGLIR